MSFLVVLGSGVVGRATGLGLIRYGHTVTFVDIDQDRLISLRDEGLAVLHTDEMTLGGVDGVFVTVPTPTTGSGVDLTYLDSACKLLGRLLQGAEQPPLLVFRSTMPPGTTRHRLIPALESGSSQRSGTDFHVCYNPEYLRAHNAVDDFLTLPYLTIGTADAGDEGSVRLQEVFASFEATVTELSYEQAEYQKYVHNVFNAVKISFFNEMRDAAKTLGIDRIEDIFALTARTAEGMWNPFYGIRNLGPFGGACLPKDTAAWAAHCRRNDAPRDLVEAVRQVNVALGGAPC